MWLHLTWEVDRKARFRTHRVEERLIAVDVSVSGMRASARTAPGVVVGSTVVLRLNEFQARAKIRRVEPSEQDDVAIYGMQFIDPPNDFIEALFVQAGLETRDAAEELWRRST
jgi:hypothetical protein